MARDKASITLSYSGGNQIVQNEQVEILLKKGVDVLIINVQARTSAVYIVRMAMSYNTPVVFINCEPVKEDLELFEKAFYVGTNPRQFVDICGKLAADYFVIHPEADKNGDGIAQVVMLKGGSADRNAVLRTIRSITAMREAGVPVEILSEENAFWNRALAKDKMALMLATFGDAIEMVVSNNDEMAIGAIEALKVVGYFSNDRYMPVLGVDAIDDAYEALEQGTLWGTVLNDANNQAHAALMLALLLADGKSITYESLGYEVTDGKYVFIPGRAITVTDLY